MIQIKCFSFLPDFSLLIEKQINIQENFRNNNICTNGILGTSAGHPICRKGYFKVQGHQILYQQKVVYICRPEIYEYWYIYVLKGLSHKIYGGYRLYQLLVFFKGYACLNKIFILLKGLSQFTTTSTPFRWQSNMVSSGQYCTV